MSPFIDSNWLLSPLIRKSWDFRSLNRLDPLGGYCWNLGQQRMTFLTLSWQLWDLINLYIYIYKSWGLNSRCIHCPEHWTQQVLIGKRANIRRSRWTQCLVVGPRTMLLWRFVGFTDAWNCHVTHVLSITDDIWLVVDLPLWNIWVRQLGWWHSQNMENYTVTCSKQPTRYNYMLYCC